MNTDRPDPRLVVNRESWMREVEELPIGSVRWHTVAHVKVDYLRRSYFLNGKCATLEELRREFARLEQIGGVIFWYTENPKEEMPPGGEAVLAAILAVIREAPTLPLMFATRDYDPAVKVAEYFPPAGT
jgi:hypothetical protein